jgi:hypothetical protein
MPKVRTYTHKPTQVQAYRLTRPETEHRPDGTTVTWPEGYWHIVDGVDGKDYWVTDTVFGLSYDGDDN